MDFNITLVDELAAKEHRQELEEEARIERLLIETAAPRQDKRRFNLIWRLLHLREQGRPDDKIRHN